MAADADLARWIGPHAEVMTAVDLRRTLRMLLRQVLRVSVSIKVDLCVYQVATAVQALSGSSNRAGPPAMPCTACRTASHSSPHFSFSDVSCGVCGVSCGVCGATYRGRGSSPRLLCDPGYGSSSYVVVVDEKGPVGQTAETILGEINTTRMWCDVVGRYGATGSFYDGSFLVLGGYNSSEVRGFFSWFFADRVGLRTQARHAMLPWCRCEPPNAWSHSLSSQGGDSNSVWYTFSAKRFQDAILFWGRGLVPRLVPFRTSGYV